MLRHLRGPLPCSALLFLLLAAAHGWRSPVVQPFEWTGTAYPLAGLLTSWTRDAVVLDFGSAALLLALAFTAAGATLAYLLLLAWTGNRIVSFLAAALAVAHPLAAPPLLGADALAHASAFLFCMATLWARERGWKAWRDARAPIRHEILALGFYVLALLSGPSAFSVPLLMLIADGAFHAREPAGARREVFAIAVLYTVVAFALWHYDRPSARDWHGTAGDFGSRAAALFLLPIEGPGAWAIAVALVAAAAAAFALGRRSLRAHPRFVLLYAGFGLGWFVLGELPTFFGCVPRAAHASLLSLVGPGLILPAAAWRVVLGLVPKPAAAGRALPVFDAEAAAARLPPASVARHSGLPAGSRAAYAAGEAATSPAAVKASVEAAVGAAVEAAVAAAGRALRAAAPGSAPAPATTPPGSRYAAEWDRYEAEWSAKAAAEGRRVLGEEWSDRDLEQNLFENYCRPHLAPHFRVLEIGQGGGKFTAMIAPEVARVVCVDVSPGMLKRAKKDLAAYPNVDYVLADGRGLPAFSSGVVDFAFAYDVFVHLDQEDIFIYLQDLRRVLRPGARAVISFANLEDPMGFRQFQREAAWHRTGRRSPGRINFLSPGILRTLASASGLEIVSVHLSANNRDMIAVIERGVR